MNEEITIRIWDDNHKEVVASDAMEFKAEGERIGSTNVLYVPKSKLDKAVKALEVFLVEDNILDYHGCYIGDKKAREILKEIKEGECE